MFPTWCKKLHTFLYSHWFFFFSRPWDSLGLQKSNHMSFSSNRRHSKYYNKEGKNTTLFLFMREMHGRSQYKTIFIHYNYYAVFIYNLDLFLRINLNSYFYCMYYITKVDFSLFLQELIFHNIPSKANYEMWVSMRNPFRANLIKNLILWNTFTTTFNCSSIK